MKLNKAASLDSKGLIIYKIYPSCYYKWLATLNLQKCACTKPNLHNNFTQLPIFSPVYQNTASIFIDICYREDVKIEKTEFSVYANDVFHNPGLKGAVPCLSQELTTVREVVYKQCSHMRRSRDICFNLCLCSSLGGPIFQLGFLCPFILVGDGGTVDNSQSIMSDGCKHSSQSSVF